VFSCQSVPLLTTTSRRRALSTWCSRLREGMQIFVRTLHRQGAQTSLGWLPLRQVSVSQDKSPPRTTSSAPTSAWAKMHGSGEATDACGEANLHVTRERQLAAIQATCPGWGLKASLTSRTTVTSPSTSTLPHARSNPRHSSTLYDAHGHGNDLPLPTSL
jgi:hypothetical protein